MNYFYDENLVRYKLVSTNSGEVLNWIFIPGGPGCDSSYLGELAQNLNLPGNTWLLDFPGNRSNQINSYDFDKWLSIFIPTIKQFSRPIIVEHSFGVEF